MAEGLKYVFVCISGYEVGLVGEGGWCVWCVWCVWWGEVAKKTEMSTDSIRIVAQKLLCKSL